MTRLCASAVVCTRSIASVAIFTAVSKPKVKSVPERSLSIVFGTPTTLIPLSKSFFATESVSSPPMAMSASQPCAFRFRAQFSSPSGGFAAGQDVSDHIEVEWRRLVFEQSAPALDEAQERVLIVKRALPHHGSNHCIQSGTVASARQHSNLHRLLLS